MQMRLLRWLYTRRTTDPSIESNSLRPLSSSHCRLTPKPRVPSTKARLWGAFNQELEPTADIHCLKYFKNGRHFEAHAPLLSLRRFSCTHGYSLDRDFGGRHLLKPSRNSSCKPTTLDQLFTSLSESFLASPVPVPSDRLEYLMAVSASQ